MSLPRLTVGMAVYDDFDGVYFSIQALRMYHASVMSNCEIIVVDNNPDSPDGKMTKGFTESIGVRYIPLADVVGTTVPRDRVFKEAQGEIVLCMDSHVLIQPDGLRRLVQYYDSHPESRDLLSGPMLYDNLQQMSTHFSDEWRAEMWGIWGTDERGLNLDAEPFEIPAMGLGLFVCRREAWLGFNPNFRGFGGEEMYIHEKFRQAGAKCLCLPFLRWGHRFGRPAGPAYPITRWNKIRNYVLGHIELGLPLDRIKEHFLDTKLIPLSEWEDLLEDPLRLLPIRSMTPAPGCGSCGGGTPMVPADITLEALYTTAVSTPSDINEHCPKLRELASQCESVTEFGMRHGVSTVALLAGQPKKFVSYDLRRDPIADSLKQRQGETVFEFRVGNSLTVEIEETDLLFIDTRHTAEQLYNELARHHTKVRRWIAMHDTQIYGENGEGGGPGLLVALRRFMLERPHWSVVYHTQANHGFTVISCQADDKPKLPSLLTMSANFAKAVATHVVSGAKSANADVFVSRLQTCSMCVHRAEERCTVCGCNLEEKAKWAESICPLGFWE